MNAKNKHVVAPWLLESLEHFSRTYIPIGETKQMETLFVHQNPQEGKKAVSVEYACAKALELLQDEDLYILKFRRLQDWFRRNAPGEYERHMGEKLPC